MIDINKLILNEKNPRIISKNSMESLKKSISEFERMLSIRPIIIDENWMVLAGHQRIKALKELGYTELNEDWVKQESDLTDSQKKEFIIKDNVNQGEFNYEKFEDEYWEDEPFEEWMGDSYEKPEVHLEAEEDNYEPPEVIHTDIVKGDLFEFRKGSLCHRLLCGDSTSVDDVEKLMNGEKADLVLTDPPYNVDYTEKTKNALKIQNDKMSSDDFYQFLYDHYSCVYTVTKKGAPWYVFHADSKGHHFRTAFIDAGIKLSEVLIWNKNSMTLSRQDYHYKHEPILYGWIEGESHKWYSDRKQVTVLDFNRPFVSKEHPTMKPIPLISYLMSNSSRSDDIVIDGFLGSGTTMVASHQLERNCYGMEIDESYCQVIVDRMLKLDEAIQVFRNGEDVTNKYRSKILEEVT